jgi:hypothetical protein
VINPSLTKNGATSGWAAIQARPGSGYNLGNWHGSNEGLRMTLLDADVKHNPVLGEDTWELFEVIEDSFGVDLGDYHALCGVTVTELASVICGKANYPTEEKCLSAVAFYRLRRAFEVLFGIPRTTIRPATAVRNLLPWKSRSTQWLMLQEHLGLKFPRLNLPGWLLLLTVFAPQRCWFH